jgi:peptide/nickel transport system substrate-binding protein
MVHRSLLFLASLTLFLGAGGAAAERHAPEPPVLSTENPYVVRKGELGCEVAPRYGGRVRLATLTLPTTFNPFLSRITADGIVINNLLPTLFANDRVTMSLVPFAASSVLEIEEGRVFEITLRQGVTWSDSGRQLDADDVMTTVALHLDPAVGSGGRGGFFLDGKPIVWSKVDDRTVRVTLPAPVPLARTVIQLRIVPAHVFGAAYATGGAAAVRALWSTATPPAELVGAGNHTVASFDGGGLTLRRRPVTWMIDECLRPIPYIGEIRWRVTEPIESFLGDESDLFSTTSAMRAVFERIDSGALDARGQLGGPALGTEFMTLNWDTADPNRRKLFRSVEFRRALSHLTDRARMVTEIFEGYGVPLYGAVTSGSPYFKEDIPKYPYDPAAAHRLLEGLGFERDAASGLYRDVGGDFGGIPLELTILTNIEGTVRSAFQARLAADLRANGFSVITELAPFSGPTHSVVSRLLGRSFDAIIVSLSGSFYVPLAANVYTIPPLRTLPIWSTGLTLAPFEPLLHDLVMTQRSELDETRRRGAIDAAQDLIGSEQPLTYLVTGVFVDFVQNRVRNTIPVGPWTPISGLWDINTIWLRGNR